MEETRSELVANRNLVLPWLKVYEFAGQLWCRSNRRLAALRAAGRGKLVEGLHWKMYSVHGYFIDGLDLPNFILIQACISVGSLRHVWLSDASSVPDFSNYEFVTCARRCLRHSFDLRPDQLLQFSSLQSAMPIEVLPLLLVVLTGWWERAVEEYGDAWKESLYLIAAMGWMTLQIFCLLGLLAFKELRACWRRNW